MRVSFFFALSALLVGCAPSSLGPAAADAEDELSIRASVVEYMNMEAGEVVLFTLEMPQIQLDGLRISLSGGTGDADLDLSYEDSGYGSSCSSHNPGNDELCNIDNPGWGTWTVMVTANETVSDMAITSSYNGLIRVEPEPEAGPEIVVDEIISGWEGIELYYTVSLEAGEILDVALGGGEGDADLYIADLDGPFGSVLCASEAAASDEFCSATGPGEFSIEVIGYTDFSDVSLLATVGGGF